MVLKQGNDKMAKVSFSAGANPSAAVDSEIKSDTNVIGTRTVLRHVIEFDRSGNWVLKSGDSIPVGKMFQHVLTFVFASLTTGNPEGDKLDCWVDATVDPCVVWYKGHEINASLVECDEGECGQGSVVVGH